MKKENNYNGYTNHATWNFNLILNNDYKMYHRVREVVATNLQDKETIIGCLKSIACVDELAIDYHNVNFNEVAETWIYDIKEEMEVSNEKNI